MAERRARARAGREPDRIAASSDAWRPRDYFGALDREAELMTRVQGVMRRRLARALLESGSADPSSDPLLAPALGEDDRRAIGRLHPAFMGGEYLPSAQAGEVEIARVTLRSTTSDVVVVRARRAGGRIHYHVADEYGGSTLSTSTCRTSTEPLTMGALVDFLLHAWDLLECLDCNFEGDVAAMHDFFSGESEFYPYFDAALRARVNRRFGDDATDDEP